MTDRALLEQAIERSGVKVAKLMEAANIKSYATFRGRLNNDTEFTASEMQAITNTLRLTTEERDRIFFAK